MNVTILNGAIISPGLQDPGTTATAGTANVQ
jgi:hypothetical protein